MNDVDFEKVKSLFESDDKECLLVFCGEYFKHINSITEMVRRAGKLQSKFAAGGIYVEAQRK
jgi:hypothetical protein